jgi:hypothetical protein
MLKKIKCPTCQTEGSISLVEIDYVGPYRCWKCRALFAVEIKNDKLISYKPLSEEELKKQQQMRELQDKYRKQE